MHRNPREFTFSVREVAIISSQWYPVIFLPIVRANRSRAKTSRTGSTSWVECVRPFYSLLFSFFPSFLEILLSAAPTRFSPITIRSSPFPRQTFSCFSAKPVRYFTVVKIKVIDIRRVKTENGKCERFLSLNLAKVEEEGIKLKLYKIYKKYKKLYEKIDKYN